MSSGKHRCDLGKYIKLSHNMPRDNLQDDYYYFASEFLHAVISRLNLGRHYQSAEDHEPV